ncbi:MAG TPA: hypothetical protein VFV10_14765 [Gammaproteobacteria bacterium]|nr:hypothetical protein [Gammaproteobacteria bacterium]
MSFIDAVQNSAYATWVRESPSILAYTTILSLHAMGLAIVVGLNTVVALRLLGVDTSLPLAPLRKLFPWMYFGFTVNAFSGLSLLAANAHNDLTNWMFYSKLTFIALAMVNMELTRSRVFESPVALSQGVLHQHARIFALNSIALWSLAIIAGRLTEYPDFVHKWFGF